MATITIRQEVGLQDLEPFIRHLLCAPRQHLSTPSLTQIDAFRNSRQPRIQGMVEKLRGWEEMLA